MKSRARIRDCDTANVARAGFSRHPERRRAPGSPRTPSPHHRKVERETGFEPATLSLGNGPAGGPGVPSPSQVLGCSGGEAGSGVHPSQLLQGVFGFLATPLLPDDATGAEPEPLLSVRQVARRLGVSTATVYKLCSRGELAHVRVLNALRIPARALAALPRAGPARTRTRLRRRCMGAWRVSRPSARRGLHAPRMDGRANITMIARTSLVVRGTLRNALGVSRLLHGPFTVVDSGSRKVA